MAINKSAFFKKYFDFENAKIPYSIEAEQAVLGSILYNPSCIADIATELTPDNFYLPQHKAIFTAITVMFSTNQVIDLVPLLEKLKADGIFDDAGGKSYLSQIIQSVPSAANVMTYVAIVKEKFYSRALMNAAKEIIFDINENASDSSKLIEAAEQRIYDIRQGRDVTGLTSVKSILENETYLRLTKLSNPETRDEYIGIPCGISDLDEKITGLNKSDLIIIGARPGMGKTSFALNIARNVALNSNKTVCFFSLEMSAIQLAKRLMTSETGLSADKIKGGVKLEGYEWQQLEFKIKALSKSALYIDDTPSIPVGEFRSKVKNLVKNKGVRLIIVDYLQLMQGPSELKGMREQEVAAISRTLKATAKEHNVPIIALSQLSRQAVQRTGGTGKPQLSDLRESGSIEQDADMVLFIHRPDYMGMSENPEDREKTQVIIAKHRNGETAEINMVFKSEQVKFIEPDEAMDIRAARAPIAFAGNTDNSEDFPSNEAF
mgnify:CR=1 FL=1